MTATTRAIFFAFAGLVTAGILSYQHLDPRALERACGPGGGCAAVRASAWANVAGVPVAVGGLGFYAIAFLAAVVRLGAPPGRFRRIFTRLLFVLILLAAVVSAGLMVVQFGVIRAFCPVCTLSAVLCGLLLIAWWQALRRHDEPASPLAAAGLGLSLLPIGWLTYVAIAQPHSGGVELLASINGTPLTSIDLNRDDPPRLIELQRELYDVKRQWLESKIEQTLIAQEAQRRGITPEALEESEIEAVIADALAGVDAWIARQKQANPEDPTAWWEVRRHAREDLVRRQRQRFVESLRRNSDVRVYLRQPYATTLRYDPALAHWLGNPDAPIRLVVFSDFQCPYCAELSATLRRVIEAHPFEVSVAFVHFPMDVHPLAADAAKAAECAAEQGLFWPYHDRLMRENAALEPHWREYAAQVGLDLDKFDACLRSPEPAHRVSRSLAAARAMHLDAVPALFLNGRRIGGAIEFDQLESMIQPERSRMR